MGCPYHSAIASKKTRPVQKPGRANHPIRPKTRCSGLRVHGCRPKDSQRTNMQNHHTHSQTQAHIATSTSSHPRTLPK